VPKPDGEALSAHVGKHANREAIASYSPPSRNASQKIIRVALGMKRCVIHQRNSLRAHRTQPAHNNVTAPFAFHCRAQRVHEVRN
jgi:hypothetical protein